MIRELSCIVVCNSWSLLGITQFHSHAISLILYHIHSLSLFLLVGRHVLLTHSWQIYEDSCFGECRPKTVEEPSVHLRQAAALTLNSSSDCEALERTARQHHNCIIRIFIRTLSAAIIHNTNTMLKKKNTLKQKKTQREIKKNYVAQLSTMLDQEKRSANCLRKL